MRLSAQPSFRSPLFQASVLTVLAALSGCDIPATVPEFDVRWVFPIEETSISVAELLPANVAIAGGNFDLTVDPVLLPQTLGGLCGGVCAAADGFTVPKPAFIFSYQSGGTLPTDVVSATLVSGSVSIGLQNDLGFDPIRPAAATTGTMTITIHDVDAMGAVLGQIVLDGATDALPNGALTTVQLVLAPGTVTSTFVAVVDIDSPVGDPVLIDVSASLDITATPQTILVSAAELDVDGRSVTFPQTSLDVGSIEADAVDRIASGSLILDIQNPFGVAIDIVVEIGGPGISTLQRNINIGSGLTSTAVLAYTQAEFASFLGQSGVFFRGSGTVTSPGATATVTPTQEALIEATLDLVLEIGGSGGPS